MSNTYFAMLPSDEIAAALLEKIENYRNEIERNGRRDLWRKAYRTYFALDTQYRHEASGIKRGGEQEELSLLKANHFRNLITHLHVILTQQRPSLECRALNTDYKSQIQTILGSNILEYYMREKNLEMYHRQALEFCLLYAEAYMEVCWNKDIGDEVAVDETGKVIKAGDVEVKVFSPDRVIRQTRADADLQLDWYILERDVSRYELMAKYPHQRDALENYSSDSTLTRKHLLEHFLTEDEDLLTVYTFYHEKTAACPEGRQVVFVGDTILDDSTLRYIRMPVYRMAAYNQHGTSFGYTVAFDLIAVQEAVDLLYSTVLSNQAAFGVQSVWIKAGSDFDETQLASGLNVLESSEKPEAIQLTNTPPEIFNFLKQIEQLGEMLSGVNSVARGQPEASLKSGSALALVASQAVQFSNGIQAAYVRMMEETGTAILKALQQYATIPRTAVIAGKSNKSYIKEFVGDDIRSINRVIVDVGNPMARLASGRIQMAQDLLQAQVIRRPEQYIQVISTGRLEPIIEDEQTELLLIRSENEALREGKKVPVTAIDQHVDHIKNHRAVLADPEARNDPALVQNTLDHIQEHINALKTVDPALLGLLGMNAIAPAPVPSPSNMPPGMQPQQAGEMGAPQPPNLPPEVATNMPAMPEPPAGAPVENAAIPAS